MTARRLFEPSVIPFPDPCIARKAWDKVLDPTDGRHVKTWRPTASTS